MNQAATSFEQMPRYVRVRSEPDAAFVEFDFAIGYPDLVSVFAGTVLSQTGQPFEVMALTMGVYLSISLGVSWLMNWYNRRVAPREPTA